MSGSEEAKSNHYLEHAELKISLGQSGQTVKDITGAEWDKQS